MSAHKDRLIAAAELLNMSPDELLTKLDPPEAWRKGPDAPGLNYPEGTHRDDMRPVDALTECYDMWASGAWDDRNAVYDLAEVMAHVGRMLDDAR